MRKLMIAACMTFGFAGFVAAQTTKSATQATSATYTAVKQTTTVTTAKTTTPVTAAKVNKPTTVNSNVQLATATPVNPDGSFRGATSKNTIKPVAKVSTEKTNSTAPVVSTVTTAQVLTTQPNSPSKLGQERDKHYSLPLNISKTPQKNQQ